MPRHRLLPALRLARASAASFAVVAALALTMALPAPVFAWDIDSLSSSAADQLLTLINQYRASKDIAPLTKQAILVDDAQWRSKYMYDKDFFAHDGPDAGSGADAFEYLKDRDYCFQALGENIAWNSYPDQTTTDWPGTVTVAFEGWQDSDGHNKVMLDPTYTRVGIAAFKGDGRWEGTGKPYGIQYGDTKANPAHVFTAVFSKPCASAKPTPKPTATPRSTPRPTATPRPTPRPTAEPATTPKPTHQATLEPTAEPTAEPSAITWPAFLGPFDALGDPAGNPHTWLRGGGLGPTPGPWSSAPTGAIATEPAVTFGPDDAALTGLQVIEPVPSIDLLDAVVSGVAGTFFGN